MQLFLEHLLRANEYRTGCWSTIFANVYLCGRVRQRRRMCTHDARPSIIPKHTTTRTAALLRILLGFEVEQPREARRTPKSVQRGRFAMAYRGNVRQRPSGEATRCRKCGKPSTRHRQSNVKAATQCSMECVKAAITRQEQRVRGLIDECKECQIM